MGRLRAARRRLDRDLPIAAKIVLPLVVMFVVVAAGFSVAAVGLLDEYLRSAEASRALSIARVVEAEYAASLDDQGHLDRFVEGLVATDPTIRVVRIYRVVGGAASVWASSEAGNVGQHQPEPHDVLPLRTGVAAQEEETQSGERLLETIYPLRTARGLDATVGVYTTLATRDAIVALALRLVLLAAVAGVLLEVGFVWTLLDLLVLRRVRRLGGGFARAAAGDFGVRLAPPDATPTRDELAVAMRQFDRMAGLIGELQDESERLARTDGLTGLANRRSFDAAIEREIALARRNGRVGTLALFDADRFKEVNDTQGHDAGDAALRAIASSIAASARASDVAARYGGDEFGLILSDCAPSVGLAVVRRVVDEVAGLGIASDPARGTRLSLSAGVTEIDGRRAANEIVKAVDRALYRAKSRGGGVELAPPADPTPRAEDGSDAPPPSSSAGDGSA